MKKVIMAVMAIFAYALIADSAMAATTTGTLLRNHVGCRELQGNRCHNVTFGAYDLPTRWRRYLGGGSFLHFIRCVKGRRLVRVTHSEK